MGDPKKLKKKYSTPVHPWSKDAINEERELMKEYALKKKKEIFIARSFMKKYKDIAKKLIATNTAQGEKETKQVLAKLNRLGLVSTDAKLDSVLGLTLKDVLERRIQSLVFRKNLARTMNQARQFIVHRHVLVGDKEVTSPTTLLTVDEENHLNFKGKSSLSSEDHPERKQPEVVKDKVVKEEPKVEAAPKEEVKPEEKVEEIKKEEAPKTEEVKETPKTEETAEKAEVSP